MKKHDKLDKHYLSDKPACFLIGAFEYFIERGEKATEGFVAKVPSVIIRAYD